MLRRHRLVNILALVTLAAALAACGGRTQVESDLGIKGAPDWVNEGTQAVNNKGGRLFHGVGQAAPMGDQSLQTSVADDRARAELAKILSSYMDVVAKDYAAAARSDGGSVAEEAVSRQIKNLTQVNLSGAKIIGRWRDEKSGAIWSIAELDLKKVQSTLGAVKDMNGALQQYIESESGNIFDRFQEAKR